MGDDLNFAQNFTRTAADGLALLAEMPDPRAKPDAPVVINMMTTVQRGAKRLRARNIYVGAQDVLSAMHHENDAVLTGRIETLGSLVTSYARGLEDLLSETSPANAEPKSVTEKWDTARETLNALLPTADPETADMLSRLIRSSGPIEGTPSDSPESDSPEYDLASQADIVPFKQKADVTSNLVAGEADIMSGDQPQHVPTSTVSIETSSVTLDAVMRDVIADALSVARSVGRTISLSYDMGEKSVSDTLAADLRQRLGQALSQIIRQALSDDRVGHIDINLAGEQLHIMAGTTAMRVALKPKKVSLPKPLITTETEQGLREQLNALMDPLSLHETAS